jgi:hypothetical protein
MILYKASSAPSGIYLPMCNNNLAGWRHIKESLRPQFFFEKADKVEGLPGVQLQS